MIGQTRKAKEK